MPLLTAGCHRTDHPNLNSTPSCTFSDVLSNRVHFWHQFLTYAVVDPDIFVLHQCGQRLNFNLQSKPITVAVCEQVNSERFNWLCTYFLSKNEPNCTDLHLHFQKKFWGDISGHIHFEKGQVPIYLKRGKSPPAQTPSVRVHHPTFSELPQPLVLR